MKRNKDGESGKIGNWKKCVEIENIALPGGPPDSANISQGNNTKLPVHCSPVQFTSVRFLSSIYQYTAAKVSLQVHSNRFCLPVHSKRFSLPVHRI
jgi:hypothetical protein